LIRMILHDVLTIRWSDSQLKAFLDRHGIPCPQPHKRDTLLAKARESWENVRKSAGDTAAVPGNWLFESWSDSDLKSWADYRGIPVPQGSKRNEVFPSTIRLIPARRPREEKYAQGQIPR
jgi:hypothetical protein